MLAYIMAFMLMLHSCVALGWDDFELREFDEAAVMPEFVMRDMNHDRKLYLSKEHPDSTFVLEFYFNGCPSCNANAKNFKRLATEFQASSRIQFLELSIDCQENAYASWVSKHRPFWPVLWACNDSFVESMGVDRFPTTMIVNPHRNIAMHGVGVWGERAFNKMKTFLDQVR